ncbi:DMT family transporter [Streptomyces beihaiensis]|uniref:DMT family transporter n=1 Tax=Streptomyces beihaiensis TaxID=2984495 RepID=A0ABT3TMN2_9ACTN|nr:DMT family transporter [Streptomyces beihaiensis]MCX3058313.1 DMT family transporter [Streptomyces beihaiensis]
MVYLFSLSAACLLGCGFVFQQHAAEREPLSIMLSFRLLLDLVRVPLWLAGIACMVVGQVLGALALAHAGLAEVEPLLTTNLLFAMALARWMGDQPLGWSGWLGAGALSGGVAAIILAGQPRSGHGQVGALRHWAVIGCVLGLAGILIGIAQHLRLLYRPPLLAAAAGTLYGLQDALTRVCGGIIADRGITGLLVSWQPWAIVGLAVVGLLLVQSAFEAGPLRLSLPALSATEPLSGIACGIGFLHDELRTTPGALAWQATGVVAAVSGVIVLGRHPVMPSGKRRPEPPAHHLHHPRHRP